jgi:hypothetical protein
VRGRGRRNCRRREARVCTGSISPAVASIVVRAVLVDHRGVHLEAFAVVHPIRSGPSSPALTATPVPTDDLLEVEVASLLAGIPRLGGPVTRDGGALPKLRTPARTTRSRRCGG